MMCPLSGGSGPLDMVVDYLSSRPKWAGYQVSTKQGSGPFGIAGDNAST